jgi:hypothetical protein
VYWALTYEAAAAGGVAAAAAAVDGKYAFGKPLEKVLSLLLY